MFARATNSTAPLPGPNLRTSGNDRGASVSARSNQQETYGESGAILILALVYIFTIGLIVAALASWTTNDLNNTAHFTNARSLQYALSSVTNTAIQSMRYNPLPTTLAQAQAQVATSPGFCWTPAGSSTYDGVTQVVGGVTVPNIDGESVAVWCSTVENLAQGTTRVVTFSACMSSVTNTACAAKPLLQVVVSYDDYPPGGGPLLTAQCAPTVNCGEGMTLQNWTWL